MEKRTSSTDFRKRARRGYTLAECMVASVLLAMSTASLSGVMAASYQHDRATAQSIQSVQSGQRLLEEVIAMPVTASSGSTATIMSYNGYVDVIDQNQSTSTIQQLDSTSSTSARTAPTTSIKTANQAIGPNQVKRAVTVKRYATLNGQESSTGDFIVVTVTVTRADGKVNTIKRLLTTAERTG